MTVPLGKLSALSLALLLAACGGADAPAADTASAQDRATPAPTPRSSATGQVLGTIEATVDGQATQWYVISGSTGGRPYASGLWMGADEGERQIAAGGFDTPDPPLDTFERDEGGTAVSYGDYRGSVLSVVVSEALGAAPFEVRFGPDQDVSEASVFYQPVATLDDVMNNTYWLANGSLAVTALAIAGDVAHLAGTFSGTFRSLGTGEAVEIRDGRFDIRDLPSLEAIQP
jgi:hypothetical protein